MVRVVLAGGGSAGHVNPLVSTAAELVRRENFVVAVGTQEGLETTLVPAAGIELKTINRVPFPRRPNADALRFPVRFRQAVAQAGKILEDAQADVAVGFGGFVSTPLYIAAKKRGIPVVIHEQNAKPGLANRYGARFAAAVGLTFASTPLQASHGLTRTVGLPLRRAIEELARVRDAGGAAKAREQACAQLGLDASRPIMVVTGGSLGAQHLNEVMSEAAHRIPSGIQVFHLTGIGKDAPVRAAVKEKSDYRVMDYLDTMEWAYACADMVVCRSGAGTVAELCALGIPAFFVPLPIGNGEQEKNAADVLAAGGARLVRNADFTQSVVVAQVLPLVMNSDLLAQMGAQARSLAPSNSAGAFADMIEEVAASHARTDEKK